MPVVSSVVEADGTVGLLLSPPFGNIHEKGLDDILNSPEALPSGASWT